MLQVAVREWGKIIHPYKWPKRGDITLPKIDDKKKK